MREDQTGPNIIGTYDELIDKTVRKECKYSLAVGATLLQAVVGRHCGRLVQIGEPFFKDAVSFVWPRNSALTLEMSNATLQLKTEGNLPSFLEYLRSREQCPLISSPTLTFKKLELFFYVAFAVCVVVFFEMIFDPQAVVSGPVATDSGTIVEGKNNENRSSSNAARTSEVSLPTTLEPGV